MKLIKTLLKLKSQFLTKLPDDDTYTKFLFPLSVLSLAGIIIWIIGPSIAWHGYVPFAQPEKRIYAVLFLALTWLLKILLWDTKSPSVPQYKNRDLQKKLSAIETRFHSVMQFLKKTTVSTHGEQIDLIKLPWYLFIGPEKAGKTALLANSGINFIMQQQTQMLGAQSFSPSEDSDWWVTRDISIIDVPAKYLSFHEAAANQDEKPVNAPVLWTFFLDLVRKYRGKKGIRGVMIALPLPDIMHHHDPKKYQATLRALLQQAEEINKRFSPAVPCYLVVTQCDKLPGFVEFFAESSNSEVSQAWGITLHQPKDEEKIHELFIKRFNALIKKLNQQLLWRLHHERNPMIRPHIKDFPLQIERLKEQITDFIKRFSSMTSLSLQGVYLTSALQKKPEPKAETEEEPLNTTHRAVQIFKEPSPASRAYFIKQFIAYGLTYTHHEKPLSLITHRWKIRAAYAASVGIIGLTAITLGRDFEHGMRHAYAVQNNIDDYQLAIQQIQDPNEHLIRTLSLLNVLQQSANHANYKMDLPYPLSFYSYRSLQKSAVIYHQALQSLLIPEIKNFFEDYLKNPLNKNDEYLYASLKAYLMLGDPAQAQADYIANMARELLAKSINEKQAAQLSAHLQTAFQSKWAPITLNDALVEQTRKFLVSKPSAQLGYIILKNIDSNNTESEINLGTSNRATPVFVTHDLSNQIPTMFTAKVFPAVLSEETLTAAKEASLGNWVLGNNEGASRSPVLTANLSEQLRTTYINHYIDIWESLLANIHIASPKNLAQTDAIISELVSNDSPLLQLLQTLRDNTSFEPILAASPKLQNISLLVEKTAKNDNVLYQIFSSLQSLHQYLQTILSAQNEKKAAFEVIATHALNPGPDPLTQLKAVAEKSPEPIKNWLDKITADSWHYLMQEAGDYIDISWQNDVSQPYQKDIAQYYPFNPNSAEQLDLLKFARFFGNPGIVMDFYHHYLEPFVDTSTSKWQWKTVRNEKLPFSDDMLHQVQYAIAIHHIFFPYGDDKLYLPIQQNKGKFVVVQGNKKHGKIVRSASLPKTGEIKMTFISPAAMSKQAENHFSINWDFAKSSANHQRSHKSKTNKKMNPLLSMNLDQLQLPPQLTEQKTKE